MLYSFSIDTLISNVFSFVCVFHYKLSKNFSVPFSNIISDMFVSLFSQLFLVMHLLHFPDRNSCRLFVLYVSSLVAIFALPIKPNFLIFSSYTAKKNAHPDHPSVTNNKTSKSSLRRFFCSVFEHLVLRLLYLPMVQLHSNLPNLMQHMKP